VLLLAAALFFAPHYEMTLTQTVLQPVFDPAGNLYFDSRDPTTAYHTLTRLDPDGNVVYRAVAAPSGMQYATRLPNGTAAAIVPDGGGGFALTGAVTGIYPATSTQVTPLHGGTAQFAGNMGSFELGRSAG
jgi:hypothetical protein